MKIKALTISQPYASLIGEKWIENRCWNTNYRGLLAIHAGKGTQYLTKTELTAYPTGRVIKIARLAACVSKQSILDRSETIPDYFIPGTNKSWLEAAQHPHCEGPFCWILEDIRDLPEPLIINGKQGLWDLPESLESTDFLASYLGVNHG